VPQALLDQLKVGGRLFAIVGTAPVMTAQVVTRVTEDGYRSVNLFETLVDPLQNAPAAAQFTF
jgi:protein-L-isoaspartate(D-aspartate) O-methyltransferase